MTEPTDHELLADYARTGAEAPFARLVARHIHLVHSAARRYTGNDPQAEEITQAVFLILARKAGSLSGGGRRRHVALSGWLYQTARLTAANALKAEARRQHRDHEAYMQTQENEADDAVWREIAPLLDDAMGRLGATDRTVLLLRFFERQTNAEVAAALGLAEGAVQKRVLRALEKLRANFAKQGVTHTAQAIAGTVTQNAVMIAPAGLVTIICANTAKGAAVATTITALANGTLKTLAMTTIQKTLITTTLIATVGAGIYEAQVAAKARAEVRTLQQQQAPLAEQIQQLQTERDKATSRLAGITDELAKAKSNNSELLKLRGEVTLLRNQAQVAAQLKSTNLKNGPDLADKSWLDRVGLLKQRLDQNPQAKIPELQFLTEQDWLNAASHKLDTDENFQTAFASLRAGGEGHFLNVAEKALRKYLEANQGQFPSDLAQLKPYFENPPTDEILQRYQIVPASDIPQANLGGKAADSLITLKVQDSDALMTLGPTGVSGSSYQDSEIMAILAPAMKALLEATPMINGKKQMDIQQLSPYLTTPEQRTAYQQLMQRHNLSSKK